MQNIQEMSKEELVDQAEKVVKKFSPHLRKNTQSDLEAGFKRLLRGEGLTPLEVQKILGSGSAGGLDIESALCFLGRNETQDDSDNLKTNLFDIVADLMFKRLLNHNIENLEIGQLDRSMVQFDTLWMLVNKTPVEEYKDYLNYHLEGKGTKKSLRKLLLEFEFLDNLGSIAADFPKSEYPGTPHSGGTCENEENKVREFPLLGFLRAALNGEI